MRIEPNMGLSAPSSDQDVYSYTQRAQNTYLMGYHDHSPGRGVRLTGASITPGSLGGIHLSDSLQTINPTQAGIQVGNCTFAVTSSAYVYSQAVSYPTAYLSTMTVFQFLSLASGPLNATTAALTVWATNSTYTGFTVNLQTTVEAAGNIVVNWMSVPQA